MNDLESYETLADRRVYDESLFTSMARKPKQKKMGASSRFAGVLKQFSRPRPKSSELEKALGSNDDVKKMFFWEKNLNGKEKESSSSSSPFDDTHSEVKVKSSQIVRRRNDFS